MSYEGEVLALFRNREMRERWQRAETDEERQRISETMHAAFVAVNERHLGKDGKGQST